MASRWSYRGADSWIPGQNIPAVGRGGSSHRQSLNAAGIQFFGNCITNTAKLPHAVQKEIYTALTGHRHHPKVDAVTVVSVLGVVSLKTARSWHQTLEEKGWSAGFTVGTPESCLASTQEAEMVDMDALPEVLPAVVDAAEIDTDSDLDLQALNHAVKSGESTQIIASVCDWQSCAPCGSSRGGKPSPSQNSLIGWVSKPQVS